MIYLWIYLAGIPVNFLLYLIIEYKYLKEGSGIYLDEVKDLTVQSIFWPMVDFIMFPFSRLQKILINYANSNKGYLIYKPTKAEKFKSDIGNVLK